MADPVSLGTLALGQIAGGITSLFAKKPDASASAAATPASTPPTPPPAENPVGTRSGAGVQPKPSFVGSSAVPQQSGFGGKTLLGQ